GLGMALYFATQGFGSVIWTVTANAVRLLASTGCGLVAIYWLDLGAIGFFVAIAGAFCAYAALTSAAIFGLKQPAGVSNEVITDQIGSHARMNGPNYAFTGSIGASLAASATNAVKPIGGGRMASKLRRWW